MPYSRNPFELPVTGLVSPTSTCSCILPRLLWALGWDADQEGFNSINTKNQYQIGIYTGSTISLDSTASCPDCYYPCLLLVILVLSTLTTSRILISLIIITALTILTTFTIAITFTTTTTTTMTTTTTTATTTATATATTTTTATMILIIMTMKTMMMAMTRYDQYYYCSYYSSFGITNAIMPRYFRYYYYHCYNDFDYYD